MLFPICLKGVLVLCVSIGPLCFLPENVEKREKGEGKGKEKEKDNEKGTEKETETRTGTGMDG